MTRLWTHSLQLDRQWMSRWRSRDVSNMLAATSHSYCLRCWTLRYGSSSTSCYEPNVAYIFFGYDPQTSHNATLWFPLRWLNSSSMFWCQHREYPNNIWNSRFLEIDIYFHHSHFWQAVDQRYLWCGMPTVVSKSKIVADQWSLCFVAKILKWLYYWDTSPVSRCLSVCVYADICVCLSVSYDQLY